MRRTPAGAVSMQTPRSGPSFLQARMPSRPLRMAGYRPDKSPCWSLQTRCRTSGYFSNTRSRTAALWSPLDPGPLCPRMLSPLKRCTKAAPSIKAKYKQLSRTRRARIAQCSTTTRTTRTPRSMHFVSPRTNSTVSARRWAAMRVSRFWTTSRRFLTSRPRRCVTASTSSAPAERARCRRTTCGNGWLMLLLAIPTPCSSSRCGTLRPSTAACTASSSTTRRTRTTSAASSSCR